MLDVIRKKQRSVVIKIVFWVIIAAFVGTIFLVWGKGSERGTEDPTLAATVNDTRIDYGEYQRAYSNLYRLYQEMYREQFNPELERQLGLRQQALDMLIDQTLLLQEAKRRGVEVTRQELVDSIAKIPAFQENGAFSRERYLQVLSAQRMNPDEFEAGQRRQLLVDKVRQQIQENISIDDAAIAREFQEQNNKINLSLLPLAPSQFENKVTVPEEKLQAWYKEHQENFRLPETASIELILFDPAKLQDDVVLEEGAYEKYYRRHIDRFEIPEQVRAAHILIRVPQDAGEEMRQEKRAAAEKILAEVQAGKDFSELARKYSDDAASAAKGGDLGYFPRGTMVAPFEQAAFALPPGQVSGIVESPFGYHIIKSEGRIEAGVKPLSEVMEEVKAGAKEEAARQLAYEKALDAFNRNRKGGSLQAAAEAEGLQVRESNFFDRDGTIEGLSDSGDITAAAFTLEPGELGRPVSLPEGVVLFALKERRESRIPELSEVRQEAESAFRGEQAAQLARQAAEKALAELREGQTISQVASGLPGKPEETGLFSRAYGTFIPRLGNSEELSKAAFALTRENPVAPQVFEQDGRFVVAVLKERQDADMSTLDPAMTEEMRQSLLTRMRNEALDKRIQELREQAEISIAPTIASTLDERKG